VADCESLVAFPETQDEEKGEGCVSKEDDLPRLRNAGVTHRFLHAERETLPHRLNAAYALFRIVSQHVSRLQTVSSHCHGCRKDFFHRGQIVDCSR